MIDAHFNTDVQALVGSDGEVVPLRPQTTDVLRLLVARAGALVTKEELVKQVWGQRAGVASDDSIYQCISEIRRAIKGQPGARLRTISRRGYMLEGLDSRSNTSISTRPLTISHPDPIHYVNSTDGTKIAWSASGQGLPIIKTPNWVTHLGAERRSKIYGPFYDRLGSIARVVRYDQRGNGLSSWDIPPFTLDNMSEDILAVADAAQLEKFHLFGMSQGVPYAIDFAARYPGRVLSIIGRGGFALGDLAGGNQLNQQNYEVSVNLMELGWESSDLTYRRHFTSRLAPDALPEMARELDELQRIAVPKENLRNFFEFDARLDVVEPAAKVKCPVLLIHSVGDLMVPFADGEHLASLLPQCQFVAISGDNHTLVPGTPGFEEGLDAIERFLAQFQD